MKDTYYIKAEEEDSSATIIISKRNEDTSNLTPILDADNDVVNFIEIFRVFCNARSLPAEFMETVYRRHMYSKELYDLSAHLPEFRKEKTVIMSKEKCLPR